MEKDLSEEIEELNKRINELEKMISVLIGPLQNVEKVTRNYLRIAGLLLDHGGFSPDMVAPEIKDPISKEIVSVLLSKNELNVSQITELVRSKRGTASRRIIRERLQELIKKDIVLKKETSSRAVYSLTDTVIKKWTDLLGFNR